ncbi:MAG: hypothetical protein EKK33_35325 [Bradyrhizobiaceae bacterium]|nr:MAG: hypothetical protein EKK33_35325 [Bradyrhizobiaceae bacterium]
MRGTFRESDYHLPCRDSPSPQPSPRKRGEGAHRRRGENLAHKHPPATPACCNAAAWACCESTN